MSDSRDDMAELEDLTPAEAAALQAVMADASGHEELEEGPMDREFGGTMWLL